MEPTNQEQGLQEVARLGRVIQIDEEKIQAHLGEVLRSTVEETLNTMLDVEADRLSRAERYERTEARKDTRAGSYQRQLHTKVGEVTVKVPKLRTLPFETAIIERYRRQESSVEEALVEMPLHANSPVRFRSWAKEYSVLQLLQPTHPCSSACDWHEAHRIMGVSVEAALEMARALVARLPSTESAKARTHNGN